MLKVEHLEDQWGQLEIVPHEVITKKNLEN